MICLPILASCGRVVSKVGEYSAPSTTPGSGVSFAGHSGGAGASAGSGSTGSAADGGSNMPIMMLPSTGSSCTFTALAASRHPLDMYVMMDSNITLQAGVWEASAMGVRGFANDPRGANIGFGLRYYGTECDSASYAVPSVPVGPIPQNAPAIDMSVLGQHTLRASETLPALQGGIAYQKARVNAHPEAKQVVVLLTDGFAQDLNLCPPYQTVDLAAAAQQGFRSAPSVETYVLELRATLPVVGVTIGDPLGGFDTIASAGGTMAPIVVNPNDFINGTADSLRQVTRLAQPCDYSVPAMTDTTRIGMAFAAVGSTQSMQLPRVTNDTACGTMDGWYLDATVSPELMKLCTTTCNALRMATLTVTPITGCKPLTR